MEKHEPIRKEIASSNSANQLISSLPIGVKQFIKFGIVGASSTLITWVLFNILYEFVMVKYGVGHRIEVLIGLSKGGRTMEIVFANVPAVTAGVINGFYWNSRWTFRSFDSSLRKAQFIKFVNVNIVGLILNTLILRMVLLLFEQNGAPAPLRYRLLANGVATILVMFWNFFANKYWTFRTVNSYCDDVEKIKNE